MFKQPYIQKTTFHIIVCLFLVNFTVEGRGVGIGEKIEKLDMWDVGVCYFTSDVLF